MNGLFGMWVELEERSYGADCRVYTPEKANKFSNVYVSNLRLHEVKLHLIECCPSVSQLE